MFRILIIVTHLTSGNVTTQVVEFPNASAAYWAIGNIQKGQMGITLKEAIYLG